LSNQHLQPYLSYLVYRYYFNLKPGKNGGGWVDTGGMRYYDRYSEQIWLTLLAKAPEITLFDYRQMLYPLRKEWEPAWKDQKVSFDYNSFFPVDETYTMAKTAGQSLDAITKVFGSIGNPIGIKSYKPYHSTGEDFLQNYLGMIGIPMDLVPTFPTEDEMILLTEQAKKDPEIVEKIKQQLISGKDVMITSGLLRAIQDRGIRHIVDLEYTDRKSMVEDFLLGRSFVKGKTPMLIPQIEYLTNDSWEIISGMDGGLGWTLLHQGKFSNATLYVLTIPENFTDLYNLPVEVLDKIREIFCNKLNISIEGPSMVSLFLYDNKTFVLHSFNDETTEMKVVLKSKDQLLTELINGEEYSPTIRKPEIRWGKEVGKEKYIYTIKLPPHSFRAFSINH